MLLLLLLQAGFLIGWGAYRLGETHETVEGNAVVGEVDRLGQRDTESVRGEGKAGDGNVVLDDVALDVAGAVGDLEWLLGVHKRRRALRPKELVVTL